MPKAKPGFYAVLKGRQPGVYLTWDECEAQVNGFTGARYKKFANAEEAEAFAGHPTATSTIKNPPSPEAVVPSITGAVTRVSPYRKPASLPKVTPLTPDTPRTPPGPSRITKQARSPSPSRKSTAKAEKWTQRQSSPDVKDESIWDVVYCDGACPNNGKPGAIAGLGVWWGNEDPRNLAERCPGGQTNNRAELTAIVRVLETTLPNKRPLIIKTDSTYSIDCFKKWLPNWLKNNFKNSTVKNAPLIRYLSALLDVHAQQGHKIRLQYVKGHAGIEGNEGADRLAVQGTTLPILDERDWDELARALKRGEDHLSWKVGKNIEIVDDDLEMYAEGLVDDRELANDLEFYVDGLASDDEELMRELANP